MVLSWNYLVCTHCFTISQFIGASSSEIVPTAWYKFVFVILTCLCWLSFLIFGLLADVWIGRYKAVLIGIVLCFISWILIGIGFIVDSYYGSKTILWSIYSFAYIFQFSGFSSFTANIIQYNIDQLVGASADELNSGIYCVNHLWPFFFVLSNAHLMACISL